MENFFNEYQIMNDGQITEEEQILTQPNESILYESIIQIKQVGQLTETMDYDYNTIKFNSINSSQTFTINEYQKTNAFPIIETNQSSIIETNLSKIQMNDIENEYNFKIQNDSEDLINFRIVLDPSFGFQEYQYDNKNNQAYLLINICGRFNYMNEKRNYLYYLMKQKNEYHFESISKLVFYNDNRQQIKIEAGICSLSKIEKKKIQMCKLNVSFILRQLIAFNIQMNQQKLYHGNITTRCILIHEDKQISSSEQLQYPVQIQVKIMGFIACSCDPRYYYDYITYNYKNRSFVNKNEINWEQILFSEMYSCCKVIYYLLSDEQREQVDSINFNYKMLQDIKELPFDDYLYYFISIFIGNGDINQKLSAHGISIDYLCYLQKLFLKFYRNWIAHELIDELRFNYQDKDQLY